MAYYFPEGSKLFYSSTIAAALTVSSVTNADPAVATTSAAHGLADFDTVLFKSGWSEANDSIFEVDSLSATTFGFTELDSSDTGLFSPGSGTGQVNKVTAWTEIQQVLQMSTSGGGPRYGTYRPLGDRQEKKQVLGYEASSIEINLGYDGNLLSQKALFKLARVYKRVGFKLLIPGGGRFYGYGILTMPPMPNITNDTPININAGISFDGQVSFYGA